MAGDWIAMRGDLLTDPAVIMMAAALGLDEYGVVGRLLRVWAWADAHTADGDASGVTAAWLDRHVGTVGFALAMESVGWLCADSEGIRFPDFCRWNTQTAKSRILGSRRMAARRSAACDAPAVTQASPQNRTEQNKKKPPVVPQGGRPKVIRSDLVAFDNWYAAYPVHEKRKDAARAWLKLAPTSWEAAVLMAAVEKLQRESPKWRQGFIPQPSTFLNGERWEDDTKSALDGTLENRTQTGADYLRALDAREAARAMRGNGRA